MVRGNMMKKKFFKSYFGDESESNVKTKFIQSRVKIVEKHVPELGKALHDYVDKTAKSRDCLDKIAVVLDNYAKAENVTTAFKLQLGDFANILLDVGTRKDAQVQAMESKVLEQLREYANLCRVVESELKLSIIASDKEKNWVKQLKRIKESHPQEPQQIALAEAEYLKARAESTRSAQNLEEQIDVFEKRKLDSVKEALMAWTVAELHYHSKALQLFTEAYRVAADIDVSSDVEEFRNKLRSTSDSPVSGKSDSILQLISHSFQRRAKFTGTGIPHPSSNQSSPRSSRLTSVSLSNLTDTRSS